MRVRLVLFTRKEHLSIFLSKQLYLLCSELSVKLLNGAVSALGGPNVTSFAAETSSVFCLLNPSHNLPAPNKDMWNGTNGANRANGNVIQFRWIIVPPREKKMTTNC
jgi:hypothetical protein